MALDKREWVTIGLVQYGEKGLDVTFIENGKRKTIEGVPLNLVRCAIGSETMDYMLTNKHWEPYARARRSEIEEMISLKYNY